MRISVLLVALVLFVGSCAPLVGQRFDSSYVEHIVEGQTTKQDILEHIGKPQTVMTIPGGEVWTYQYLERAGFLDSLLFTYGLKGITLHSEILRITFQGDRVGNIVSQKTGD